MNLLKEKFTPFYQLKRTDKKDAHLFGDAAGPLPDRLPHLLLNAYADVQTQISKGFCIPSPMYILYQMLTVPDEPQSAAYALQYCRSLLYEMFKVFPEHPLHPKGNYTPFNIQDISETLDAFAKAVRNRNNISVSVPTRLMLAHFISMKGIFYLRFKDEQALHTYLDEGNISTAIPMAFHKVSFYDKLPDASSLMNELSGIPLPIKGAETIFQGGLKTSASTGLVIRISGDSGSGKTSFALALSAVLSPFGTQSFYLSLEEKSADLKERLHALYPGYLRGLSIDKKLDDWFRPADVPLSAFPVDKRFKYFEEIISQIKETLNEPSKREEDYLPSVCPLLIVIDSIRPLIREGVDIEKFIEDCRSLNAVVILISSNSENFHHEIDYMVDVVINLKCQDTEKHTEKPVRILQLLKTRHQVSRIGAHVFHLSGNSLSIYPQLTSQIDKVELVSRPLPSDKYYIDYCKDSGNHTNLKLWDESQILLHGYGSSGKASLALHLLMYPLKKELEKEDRKNENDTEPTIQIQRKRKVLVISLLYSQKYYKRIEKRLRKSTEFQRSSLECICFYAGYLTSEGFINKIL
ncbi:MAG: hypothetical protein LBD27_01590, partial [Tannerella sp.]|nr:hypothetical protein [Tannerella sp.]